MRKKCPHCNEIIEYLKVEGNYTQWGWFNGAYDLDDRYCDWDNSDIDGTDETDIEYFCPECGHYLDEDDLLDENEEEEKEEDKKTISNTVKSIIKDSLKQV